MAKLVGCAANYLCGAVKLPERGWTLEPWCMACFQKGGSYITVGNESCPSSGNTAAIKDFEFGMTDSTTCHITVHDTGGSSFVNFMNNIITNWENLTPQSALTMKFQWGWVKSGCSTPVPQAASKIYTLMPMSVDCSFTQGKFVFNITAVDQFSHSYGGRVETNQGDAKNGKDLMTAIRDLVTNTKEKPTASKVAFYRLEAGVPKPCGFSTGLPDPKTGKKQGPVETWQPQGRDKLHSLKSWIAANPTDRLKGWVMAYDATNDTLIFWEDAKPKCGETKDWCSNSLGTYIVNGGGMSPVIEFNPKINWVFTSPTNAGGMMGGVTPMLDAGVPGGKNPGDKNCDTSRLSDPNNAHGLPMHTTVDDRTRNKGQDGQKKKADAQTQDSRANKLIFQPIEADLVLVGDPTLISPSLGVATRNISIVFINPYHIMGTGTNLTWLEQPTCNEVLTNKGWLVRKITHKITAGRYVSVLTVYLAVPGVDLNNHDPVGGPGSGGWTPS